MLECTFEAAVQYGDWEGTSSADSSDTKHLADWLLQKGHLKSGDLLVGVKMDMGEQHGIFKDPIWVEVLFVEDEGYDSFDKKLKSTHEPVAVKRVEIEMKVKEFLSLFKRLKITLSAGGIFEGRAYTTT